MPLLMERLHIDSRHLQRILFVVEKGREVRCFINRRGVCPDNRRRCATVVRRHAYAFERLAYRWMLTRLLTLLLHLVPTSC